MEPSIRYMRFISVFMNRLINCAHFNENFNLVTSTIELDNQNIVKEVIDGSSYTSSAYVKKIVGNFTVKLYGIGKDRGWNTPVFRDFKRLIMYPLNVNLKEKPLYKVINKDCINVRDVTECILALQLSHPDSYGKTVELTFRSCEKKTIYLNLAFI